ncbi:hypothetical protein BDP55DRAFT_629701 [Colletotrichum godetiae]|uniref:Uncharacterized protein n=1 Tax=Colletotrichum godetiae TaxID=1209918 RepID=A0AAJ0AQP3_9PEZI|nr:uncharacterized protein BDP55DRAFT_629701 [Colletotrichum godetiae]KAK1688604.1 hypothetical protein BDP55DRAFT_629701 [Colletotrichum godetiae]
MLDGWDILRLQMARSNFSPVGLSVPSVPAVVWGWKAGGDWGTRDWGGDGDPKERGITSTPSRSRYQQPQPTAQKTETTPSYSVVRRTWSHRAYRACHGTSPIPPLSPSSPAADLFLASSPDTCKKRNTGCSTVTNARLHPSIHIRSMFRSHCTRQVGYCPTLRPCSHTEDGWIRVVEVSEQTAPPMSEEVVEVLEK